MSIVIAGVRELENTNECHESAEFRSIVIVRPNNCRVIMTDRHPMDYFICAKHKIFEPLALPFNHSTIRSVRSHCHVNNSNAQLNSLGVAAAKYIFFYC